MRNITILGAGQAGLQLAIGYNNRATKSDLSPTDNRKTLSMAT